MAIVLFAADDGVHGAELWEVDTVTGAASIPKNITPTLGAGATVVEAREAFEHQLALLDGYARTVVGDGPAETGGVLMRTAEDDTDAFWMAARSTVRVPPSRGSERRTSPRREGTGVAGFRR